MSNLCTIKELSSLTGYSLATIHRHRKDNVLRIAAAVRKVPGLGLRVDLDAAEKYVRAARPGIIRMGPVWRYEVPAVGEIPHKHLMRRDNPQVAECGARGPFLSSTHAFKHCLTCRARARERGVAYDES
jgi:hypothetical protein